MPARPSKLLASLSFKVSVVLAAVVFAACGGGDTAVPEAAVSDVFRDQLLAAPDANTRRLLLEERRQLLLRSVPQQPFSRERRTGSSPLLTDAAVIASIKQQRASVLIGGMR